MGATEQLINEFADIPVLKVQGGEFLAILEAIEKKYDILNSKSISLGGLTSSKEITAQIKLMQTELNSLQKTKEQMLTTDIKTARVAVELEKANLLQAKAARENAAAALLMAKAENEKAKSSSIATKSIIDQNKELDRQIALEERAATGKQKRANPLNDPDYVTSVPSTNNVSALEEEKNAANATGTVVNDLEKAHVADTIAAIEWANAQKAATAAAGANQKAVKLTADQLLQNQKVEIEDKLIAAEQQTILKRQVIEQNNVKGSLDQRRAALARLNAEYDKQGPQQRASAAGLRLQTIIGGLTTQVKTLEEATGRSQRSVGAYGNAITDAAGKAFSALRKIAYILPGVGLAGLIGFLVDPIIKFVSTLGGAKKAIEEQNDVIEAAKDKFADAGATVQKLTVDVDLAKKGFIDKNVVVKEYNDTMGKAAGQVTTLSEVEKKLIETGPAYIQFMFLKAAATESFARASKEAVDAELQNQKDLQRISKITIDDKEKDGLGEFVARGEDNLRKAAKEAGDKRTKTLNDIGTKFETDAAEISKKFNFNFDGEGDKGKQEAKLKTFIAKQNYELLKAQIDLEKQLSEAVDIGESTRLQFRKKAFEEELGLLQENHDQEIAIEQSKLDDVLNSKAGKNEKINAQREFNAKTQELNDAFYAHSTLLESKFQDDLIKIQATAREKKKDDNKKDNEVIFQTEKEGHDKLLKLFDDKNQTSQSRLEQARDEALAELDAKRQVDIVGKEVQKKADQQYDHDRLKINADYLKSSLTENIEYYELLLELEKAAKVETPAEQVAKDKELEKLKAQIAALKAQLAAAGVSVRKDEKKGADEDLEGLIKTFEKIQEVSGKITDVIGGALNAYIVAQKNALQDQYDAIEKNSAREIEAVNNSLASEQDKAAKITVINARVQAQKEQIAQRQRQLDQQKASFDKVANIAGIITATALAVVKALPNIPLALIVGALGAAQLGVAIATPIPHYRTGTENHPGGKFIGGDGGKPEFVLMPSGDSFVTASRDTLYDAPKGTRVFPDANNLPDDIMRMSMKPPRQMPQAYQLTKEDYAKVMRTEFSRMIRANGDRIQEGTQMKDGELRKYIKKHNSFTEYINRSV